MMISIDSVRLWDIEFLIFIIPQNFLFFDILIQTRISRKISSYVSVSLFLQFYLKHKEEQSFFQNEKMRLRQGCKNHIVIISLAALRSYYFIASKLINTLVTNSKLPTSKC